jgi:hypothetical protein
MLGLMLVGVGLMVTSTAFISEGVEGEGMIVIFPFVIGNVSGVTAAIFTALFFAFFILSSLLPWYVFGRRRGFAEGGASFKHEDQWRSKDSDTMEYIITTELPRRLRKSIYFETDGGEIHLRSTEGESFLKSYSLPNGFEVDEINYDYEGDYLVLKLLLKRSV